MLMEVCTLVTLRTSECTYCSLLFISYNAALGITTQNAPNISHFAEVRKERTKIDELCIIGVVEP
jgi:hypothetical protein